LDRNSFRRILMEESIRRRKLYESVLAKVPIFKSLLPYERSKIADALESVTFKDGEVILVEGSIDTDKFYIIERGEVVCTKASSDGLSQVESSRLKAGDFFGELALLTNEPRKATVTAIGTVKCLTIGREHFNQVMGPCEDILRRNIVNYKSYEELLEAKERQVDGADKNIELKSDSKVHNEHSEFKFDDLPGGREEVIKYIIANEYTYFYNLRQTEGYFKAISSHKQEINISEEQIQVIFSNFNDILDVHKKANFALQKIKDDDEDPVLGSMLNNLATALSVYEVYTKNSPIALQTLQKCKQHTSFTDFLMACRKEAGEALDTLLELPLRRVDCLLELIRHLLDVTETGHQDKNLLAIALRKFELVSGTLKELRANSSNNTS